jgi:hypothetical protein
MKTAALLSTSLGLAILVSPLLHAADQGKFELQHRSEFKAPMSSHNPFWPIGWVPPVQNGSEPEAVDAGPFNPDAFTVSSVLLGASPQLAVINNHDYALGEMVPVGGSRAQLVGIRDGAVVLRYGGRDYVIELKIH